jgi:hypothetical protein
MAANADSSLEPDGTRAARPCASDRWELSSRVPRQERRTEVPQEIVDAFLEGLNAIAATRALHHSRLKKFNKSEKAKRKATDESEEATAEGTAAEARAASRLMDREAAEWIELHGLDSADMSRIRSA